MTAPLTPITLSVIRRNAGRVPAPELASALGWPMHRLETVAREHGYDLKIPPPPVHASSLSAASVSPPTRCRTEYINVALMPEDVGEIDAIAHHLGLRRARVASRIIENARAKGLLLELAKLPAPLPEKTGNLDEEG